MRAKLHFSQYELRLDDHAGEDFLTVFFVGDADGCALEHRRMSQQRFVDFTRRDVLAALDDQLLQTAGDEIESIGITIAEVARCKPAFGVYGVRCALRCAEVTEHHVVAAHLDFAVLAVAQNRSIRRDNTGLHAERRSDAPLRGFTECFLWAITWSTGMSFLVTVVSPSSSGAATRPGRP